MAEPLPVVSKFEPEVLRLIVEAEGLKDEERDALTAFYEGRGDDLLWIEDGAFNTRAEAAMAEIQRADDWGLEASAFELPSAPQSDDPAEIARAELKLSLAVLKYANHARGGRINPRQLSNYIDREPPLLPPSDVLAGIAQADAVDAYLRGLHPQHPQFEKLRQAYLDIKRNRMPVEDAEADVAPKGKAGKAKGGNKTTDEAKLRKILHNMEQWRWMPEDLGRFYVWANVPEFTLRVVHNGETIHSERLIVGKPDTQTPIFSDEMETIVFHPFWGVPNSIKVKEILPGLIREETSLNGTICGFSIAAATSIQRVLIGGELIFAISTFISRQVPATCLAWSNSCSRTSMPCTCMTRRRSTSSPTRSACSATAACVSAIR